MPSAPTVKAYRGTLPYSICTAAERFAVAGLAHVAQTEAYAAVAGSVIQEEVDGLAGIHTGVNVGRQQIGVDVGNMHALRLLLITQCPLHSRTNSSPDGRMPFHRFLTPYPTERPAARASPPSSRSKDACSA